MTDDYDIPVIRGMGGFRGGMGGFRGGMGGMGRGFRGGFPGGFRRGFPGRGFRGGFGRFGFFPFFFGPWGLPWYGPGPGYYPPYGSCYTYDPYGRCVNPYGGGYGPVMAPDDDAEAEYVSSGLYDYDLDGM